METKNNLRDVWRKMRENRQICANSKIKEKQILSQTEDENLVIYGYKPNLYKIYTTYVFYFLTFGLLRLIFHWFPKWRLYATHTKCNLKIAEKVLVMDTYQETFKSYFVKQVHVLSSFDKKCDSSTFSTLVDVQNNDKLTVNLGDGYVKEMIELRAIWCKKLCYVWDEEKMEFTKLVGLDKGRKCFEYHQFTGFSREEQSLRTITYGKNVIDIPTHSVKTLLVLEALTPFYIFQVFSLITWFCNEYYYYTIAIVIMSVFGITTSIIQTRRNQKSLRATVQSGETATVLRGNGEFEEISSQEIVPGDVIEIPRRGCVMQCDAVLLNGSCIVNESMLTGESVPVTKTPLSKTGAAYDIKEDSFHTLFGGTKVIQTRIRDDEKILAVVLRTGFLTSKGELVRSILYPPPSDFKFDRDSYYFIIILVVVAMFGCIYTIVSKSGRSIAVGEIILKAIDLITIVVPPALPAAMTVGKLYALNRLKKKDVYCINSRVINVSGSIDCVCFDKTGTLTEEGLDLWGVIPIKNKEMKDVVKEPSTVLEASPLLRGMATCHSLTIIENKILGDPLDIKIFESTEWFLKETTNALLVSPQKITNPDQFDSSTILRQYQFSSTLQRMSVIIKRSSSDSLEVFCKGSPEMIISLSKSESIPVDIQENIKLFAGKGYRVIALGRKILENVDFDDIKNFERAMVESDLEIIGLIVLENRIKPETPEIIKVLKEANIKTVMITGDNIETALSVAKECGIIVGNEVVVQVDVNSTNVGKPLLFTVIGSHDLKEKYSYNSEICLENGDANTKYVYATTGTTWSLIREHCPEWIAELVGNGVVFARMSGLQKQQIIQELKRLGYYSAMCGDGANDCGALKAAHVGISLSEEESSVASPFTSKDQNIACVPNVIKEGRAALTTSMGIFKFMICYSLTQFTSVVILYAIDSNLTPLEFLFIDICLVLHFTSIFGKTNACKGPLDRNPPLTSLLSAVALTSILFQMSFVIAFQAAAYTIIQSYTWFTPFIYTGQGYSCYENYAIFSISLFQYIILAIAFSKGKPYRMPIFTNKIFMSSLFVMTCICVYLVLYPARWIIATLEIKLPPNYDAGLAILGFALAHFVCSTFAEELCVGFFLDKKVRPKLRGLIKRKTNVRKNLPNFKIDTTEAVVFNDIETTGKKNNFVNRPIENQEISRMTKL